MTVKIWWDIIRTWIKAKEMETEKRGWIGLKATLEMTWVISYISPKGNSYSDFCYYWLVLVVFEVYIKSYSILFCLFVSWSGFFYSKFMLLHVAVSCSLFIAIILFPCVNMSQFSLSLIDPWVFLIFCVNLINGAWIFLVCIFWWTYTCIFIRNGL